MKLTIQNLLPVYFPESRKQDSEIWGQNLTFESGEMVKIVAPSGSGKTSLMHFLYGIRSDYSGTISYADRPIKKFTAEDFAVQRKDNVSIVLQDMRLLSEQTVLQNLEIKRQLNPHHPKEKIADHYSNLIMCSSAKFPYKKIIYD